MAVTFADLAAAAVDEELALLSARDLAPLLDRLFLRGRDRRRARVALADDGPLAVTGDDVLVLALGHVCLKFASIFDC